MPQLQSLILVRIVITSNWKYVEIYKVITLTTWNLLRRTTHRIHSRRGCGSPQHPLGSRQEEEEDEAYGWKVRDQVIMLLWSDRN